MKSKTIYAVKDNYADSKSVYGGTIDFITWEDKIPARAKKYIDTGRAYFHTYYFTSEEEQKKKADEIYKIYHVGVQEKQKESKTLADIVNKFEYEQNVYCPNYDSEETETYSYIGYVGNNYIVAEQSSYDTYLYTKEIDEVFETKEECELAILENRKSLLEEDLKAINENIERVKKEIANDEK